MKLLLSISVVVFLNGSALFAGPDQKVVSRVFRQEAVLKVARAKVEANAGAAGMLQASNGIADPDPDRETVRALSAKQGASPNAVAAYEAAKRRYIESRKVMEGLELSITADRLRAQAAAAAAGAK